MTQILFLAARTLLHRRGSFALLLLAIAGSLGLQIANTANLQGYSRELFVKGVVYAIGHVVVTARDSEPIPRSDELTRRLRDLPGVRTVAPRYAHPGVLFHRGARYPVNAVGVDPDAEEQAARLCARVADGRCFAAAEEDVVLLGRRLADKLHVAAGDSVELVLPVEDLGTLRYTRARLKVVGVHAFSGGFSVLEYGCFLPLSDLRRRLEWPGAATSVHLYLRDAAAAPEAAVRAQQAAGADLVATAWSELNADVASAIHSNAIVNRISQIMVVLAVLIPTLALLWINVQREQPQIAALAAVGFTRGALFAVYLSRAVLLGLAGVALGAGLGLGLCRFFQARPIYASHGFVVTPVLDLTQLLSSAGLVLLVTILGGLLPALRAAGASPAAALREA